ATIATSVFVAAHEVLFDIAQQERSGRQKDGTAPRPVFESSGRDECDRYVIVLLFERRIVGTGGADDIRDAHARTGSDRMSNGATILTGQCALGQCLLQFVDHRNFPQEFRTQPVIKEQDGSFKTRSAYESQINRLPRDRYCIGDARGSKSTRKGAA